MASLQRVGFVVEAAPSTFSNIGLFAAPDSVRARELEEMFVRPDIDAVFCARGGVGCSRLLEILDTDLIAAHPKPFLGFSDITVLQWYLFAKHKLISFSGPLAIEWDGSVSPHTQIFALQMLQGRNPANLLEGFAQDNIAVLRGSGVVQGRLFSGNLAMITTLLGTPYLPDLTQAILLIEDISEAPYRVDRMLFHLRNAGILNNLAALLVGDFQLAQDPIAWTYLQSSLLEATRGTEYPIVVNLPYGHGSERMTLPVGAEVTFDAATFSLSLNEAVLAQEFP